MVTTKTKKKDTLQDEFKKSLSKEFYNIFKSVILTEKSTKLAEFENKLVFEVDKRATKSLIKMLVENEFEKKVKRVNTLNSISGKKLAIVTFVDKEVASDLSSELGLS